MESTAAGRAQINEFVHNRLNCNEVSFWEPLARLKIKTFDLAVKKVNVKDADDKMFAIGGDRDSSFVGS